MGLGRHLEEELELHWYHLHPICLMPTRTQNIRGTVIAVVKIQQSFTINDSP